MADETYSRVGARVWLERWDDDTMLVALYLLTCKHRLSEGIYHLPLQYIAADRRWALKRVGRAIQNLIDDGFIEYDDDAEVVLVVNALKWQAPNTENHKKGAVRKLRLLPPNGLMGRFLEQARCLAPDFAEYIAKEMPDAI